MAANELGWTSNSAELLKHRIMRELAKHGTYVTAAQMGESLGEEARTVGLALGELCEEGLAQTIGEGSAAADYTEDGRLTLTGKTEVQRWTGDGSARRQKRACAAAMLNWLDSASAGQHPSTLDFHGNVRAHYFGELFTQKTVWDTAQYLKKEGLIHGQGTGQSTMLRMALTPDADPVLEGFDGDIQAAKEQASQAGTTYHGDYSITNVHDSTSVAVQNSSPGATQSVHATTEVREAVLEVVSGLEQLLRLRPEDLGLDEQQTFAAYAHLGRLRDEIESLDEDPEPVRRRLSLIRDLLVSASGSGIVQAAATALDRALQAFQAAGPSQTDH